MDTESINPTQRPLGSGSQARPTDPPPAKTDSPAQKSSIEGEDTVSLSPQSRQALEQAAQTAATRPDNPDPDAGEGTGNDANSRRRQFQVTDNHEVVLKIIDQKTKEIVKQIPPEDELQLREAMQGVVDELLENDHQG